MAQWLTYPQKGALSPRDRLDVGEALLVRRAARQDARRQQGQSSHGGFTIISRSELIASNPGGVPTMANANPALSGGRVVPGIRTTPGRSKSSSVSIRRVRLRLWSRSTSATAGLSRVPPSISAKHVVKYRLLVVLPAPPLAADIASTFTGSPYHPSTPPLPVGGLCLWVDLVREACARSLTP